jgi:hypothetical protein
MTPWHKYQVANKEPQWANLNHIKGLNKKPQQLENKSFWTNLSPNSNFLIKTNLIFHILWILPQSLDFLAMNNNQDLDNTLGIIKLQKLQVKRNINFLGARVKDSKTKKIKIKESMNWVFNHLPKHSIFTMKRDSKTRIKPKLLVQAIMACKMK